MSLKPFCAKAAVSFSSGPALPVGRLAEVAAGDEQYFVGSGFG